MINTLRSRGMDTSRARVWVNQTWSWGDPHLK